MRIYQNYITGDDGDYDGYGSSWLAQTFTPQAVHMISKVKLKLFRVGDPGTVIVSIKATSAGKPTGADLCTGNFEGTDITLSTDGEWYEITLGDGYTVTKNTQYAIVVRAPDGDASNKVSWRAKVGDSTYPGGTYCSSSDSGIDWGVISGSDCMFEEWGVGEPSPTTTVWGNLVKSAISAEKIEEAIARFIQSHEEDPDAHIEEGESLYSHKASETIDHLVASVVSDKLKTLAVSIDKIDMTKFFWQTVFETLDNWVIYTTLGGAVEGHIGSVRLATAATANSIADIHAEAWDVGYGPNFSKNPRFTAIVKIEQTTPQEIYLVYGDKDDNAFGFKIGNSTIYPFWIKDSSGYTGTPVSGITLTNFNRYKAVYTYGSKIEFYVNDVLAYTATTNLPTEPDIADWFRFSIQTWINSPRLMFARFLSVIQDL